MNLNRKKGVAQLFVVAIMAFLALGIPLTTKLVQQNQENRSHASSAITCVSEADIGKMKCEDGKRHTCKKGEGYYWSKVLCAKGCNSASTDCNPNPDTAGEVNTYAKWLICKNGHCNEYSGFHASLKKNDEKPTLYYYKASTNTCIKSNFYSSLGSCKKAQNNKCYTTENGCKVNIKSN